MSHWTDPPHRIAGQAPLRYTGSGTPPRDCRCAPSGPCYPKVKGPSVVGAAHPGTIPVRATIRFPAERYLFYDMPSFSLFQRIVHRQCRKQHAGRQCSLPTGLPAETAPSNSSCPIRLQVFPSGAGGSWSAIFVCRLLWPRAVSARNSSKAGQASFLVASCCRRPGRRLNSSCGRGDISPVSRQRCSPLSRRSEHPRFYGFRNLRSPRCG